MEGPKDLMDEWKDNCLLANLKNGAYPEFLWNLMASGSKMTFTK